LTWSTLLRSWRRMGLRRALLTLLLPGLSLLMGVELAVSWRSALDTANAAYDRSLLGAIKSMDANVSTASGGLSVELPFRMLEFFELTANGEVFYRVASADGLVEIGHAGMPDPVQPLVEGRPQFHDALYQGVPVRLGSYTRRLAQPLASGSSSDRIIIQVAETLGSRRDFTRRLLLDAAARDVLLLGAGLAWLTLAVSAVLRPLGRLRRDLLGRSDDDLQSVPDADLPADVRPLVQALNEVLRRYDAALAARRRFIDDASHQLRTPLATLRTQIGFARRASDPVQVQQALDAIDAKIDDTIRQTNQMLALARAEGTELHTESFDLAALAETVTRSAWPLARSRGVDLGLDTPAALLPAQGHAGLLQEALSNLVHNAILYTPPGGSVTVCAVSDADGAILSVRDNGPGIPPADIAHVGERFLRVRRVGPDAAEVAATEPASSGSGLGLAIAQAIARRHGGQLTLCAAQDNARRPGLLVSLSWPSRATASNERRLDM